MVDEHHAGEVALEQFALEVLHHGTVFVANMGAGLDFHFCVASHSLLSARVTSR